MRFYPGRITRYILTELWGPTVLALMVYLLLLLTNHFFQVAEQALKLDFGFLVALRLLALGIPKVLALCIPMATLLGALIAVGRISSDHEYIGLQGAGRGPGVLLWPLALFGLMASVAGVYVLTEVYPASSFKVRELTQQTMRGTNLASNLTPRVFFTRIPNIVLFVDKITAGEDGRLENVLLVSTEPNTQRHQLLLAKGGDIYPAPDGSGALILDLYDGIGQLYDDRQPDTFRRLQRFASLRERIEPSILQQLYARPTEKAIANYDTRELLVGLLDANVEWKEVRARHNNVPPVPPTLPYLEAGKRHRDFNVELHSRLALPFASFCFALLAVPLGIRRIRSGKGAGFAMSLLVILVYWTLYTSLRNAALRGQIPPAMIWLANFAILLWFGWGLWKLRWPQGQRAGPFRRVFVKLRSVMVRRLEATRQEPATTLVDRAETELVELTNLGGTSSRFVRRTDQYIGFQYLRVLGVSLASAYLIFALLEFKPLAEAILRRNMSFSPLLEYFPLFLAGRLWLVLPIASLCAAVVTFTLLARNGELTAMKALGISMRRATMPVLGLTLLFCAASFLIQDYISPQANRRAAAIESEIRGTQSKIGQLRAHGSWAFGSEGKRLYHYRVYDARAEQFQGLRVFDLDRETLTIRSHRFAERARWNGEQWELEGGWLRLFDEHGGERFSVHEPGTLVTLDPPDNFETGALSLIPSLTMSEQMSRREIQEEAESLAAAGLDITQLRLAYHVKLSMALAPFVMVLLALPFAFRVGRKGSLYGIGVALLLVMVYWAVFAIFRSLGSTAVLEPILAAWAPNILFSLSGMWLMLYIRS